MRSALSFAQRSPVASQYSCSPHIGGSDSLKDERRPVAFLSQFQPPSGHCHSTSERASSSTRGSPAMPSRQQTASAFPSCDPQRRVSPSITWILLRWLSDVSQSSTVSAAACARSSSAGIPSSTSETSRQCAPPHFW